MHDFLWEYYSLRPAQLERWHPGVGVAVAGSHAAELIRHPGYVRMGDMAFADPSSLGHRVESVGWIESLLQACATRPPFFACFGLHEWAMVYRTGAIRHPAVPLRLQPEEIARVVESLPMRCTHFDAFRFFSDAARPLNTVQPDADSRLEHEQPGCIHVTMDLYKWSYKLLPFVPGELVADAFELALAAREVDMRASPYDLRDFGYEPIAVETAPGRVRYEHEQRVLQARARPVRQRLSRECGRILARFPITQPA